jgi:hypothetical protein
MWLGHSLGSGEASTLDGALDTLFKVAEDGMDQVGLGGLGWGMKGWACRRTHHESVFFWVYVSV